MNVNNDDFCIVLITAGSIDNAEKIAQELVTAKLAACVNIVSNVKSVYFWQGSLQKDSELLLIAKARRESLNEFMILVKKLHTYEVPEIIALPIASCSQSYLNWMKSCLDKQI